MAVGQLAGAHITDADMRSRVLTVQYEPSIVTVKAIQQALSRTGYDSTGEQRPGPCNGG